MPTRTAALSRLAVVALFGLITQPACVDDDYDPDAEYGMDGPLTPTPLPGKDDSMQRKGLAVDIDSARTQVWTVRNRWEDRDTAAARKAGLAWAASSGLSWDEKYVAWIDSMEKARADGDFFDSFTVTTPWGKTLPSPSLECAETSIFLRIAFAAWYELPFFMEAVDGAGNRVYFGHFGVRTTAGRYRDTPEYALAYRDHSSLSPAQWKASWPKDAALRRKHLAGGTDEQPALGRGELTFGAYADEAHLNKRAAHFTMLALNYLGSMHLADSANTYNIVAEAVRPGDTLIERWQKNGVGHSLVVKQVAALANGSLDVTLVSGSMPRRQGKWESGLASKQYFTDETTGGEGTAADGTPFAKLGGGLKRWRVAKAIGGVWTNTFMRTDEAHWINSTDFPRIAARPAQFERLLGRVPAAELKAALLALIADARVHLHKFPASCSARERRERAFADLYELMAEEFQTSAAEVDRQFREDEDYTFAPLEYVESKTCCWNSTNTAMAEIVLDELAADQAAADAAGECRTPVVFKSQPDGYARWQRFAAATGRAAAWRTWTEDEPCPQRNVAEDSEQELEATDFCAL